MKQINFLNVLNQNTASRLSLFILLVLISLEVQAAEVKIFDADGLLRAVKVIKSEKAKLKIKTKESGQAEMILIPVNGIGIERRIIRKQDQLFSIDDLISGQWKIQSKLKILEVKISE